MARCTNARIVRTSLGGFDGGTSMLEYWLILEMPIGTIGYGGHLLGHDIKGEMTGAAADILDVLRVVGVTSWEDLKGAYVRV